MAFNQSLTCDDGDARDAHSSPFNIKKKKGGRGIYLSPQRHRPRRDGVRWASPSSQASRWVNFGVFVFGNEDLVKRPSARTFKYGLLINSQGFCCPRVTVSNPSEPRRNGLKRYLSDL